MDGVNSVNSLTAQINALQAAEKAGAKDADAMQLILAQNFNKMLDDLVSSSGDTDDDDDKGIDPFSFLTGSNQTYAEQLMRQNEGAKNTASEGLAETLENNPLALQLLLNQGTDLSF
jgi:hypothetical protein